ncbi:MAG TPA: SAM-dependent methyltransferase [Microscillaceae bacterium]|nr:SAM-dependent methyltransferase [Microscillaceae bacterium]
MSEQINSTLPHQDWISDWFNSYYYHLLYQNRNEAEAHHFLDQLQRLLGFTTQDEILDLGCGKGRHALYLHRKGFKVIGVDIAENNIKHLLPLQNERLRFIQHDMREVLQPSYFDYVLSMFTSFGYYDDEAENLKVLLAIEQSLKKGGKLVLDYLNPARALRDMLTLEIKPVGGVNFKIERSMENGVFKKLIKVQDGNKILHFEENVKNIAHQDFQRYFTQASLTLLSTFGNYNLDEYDPDNSPRMIFVVEK